MNRNRLKYIFAVLPLALMLFLQGCVNEEEGPCPDDGSSSYVMFRVVTPKAMITKATTRSIPDVDGKSFWGDEYLSERGVDFDNALLKNEFEVFITKADGTSITKLENLICFEATDASNNVVLSFSGQIPNDKVETLKASGNAKIHIAANCSSPSELSDNVSFSHIGQPSDSFTAIPMWGVKEYDFSKLQPGQNDAGDIWLLRAMAKVEIVIRESDGDRLPNLITALNSASVANVTSEGYLLPLQWNNVDDTKEIKYEYVREKEASVSTKLDNIAAEENNKKIVFYLPEKLNNDGSTEISLHYTTAIAGHESKDGVIKFAKYENGSPSGTYHDIVRNHLYRFEVYWGGNSDNLEILYTVCPWNEYEITPPPFN